jgi:hypothetical protein
MNIRYTVWRTKMQNIKKKSVPLICSITYKNQIHVHAYWFYLFFQRPFMLLQRPIFPSEVPIADDYLTFHILFQELESEEYICITDYSSVSYLWINGFLWKKIWIFKIVLVVFRSQESSTGWTAEWLEFESR